MIDAQILTTQIFPHRVEWIKCKISGTFFLFELIYLLIIHESCWEVEEGHIHKISQETIHTMTTFFLLFMVIKINYNFSRHLEYHPYYLKYEKLIFIKKAISCISLIKAKWVRCINIFLSFPSLNVN